jgi:hypothetical protein
MAAWCWVRADFSAARRRPLGHGLLAGLGYNGRGVAMATVMGRLLARRLLGVPLEELGYPVTAVRPITLHRFNQAGVRLAIGYQQLRAGLARIRRRFGGSSGGP